MMARPIRCLGIVVAALLVVACTRADVNPPVPGSGYPTVIQAMATKESQQRIVADIGFFARRIGKEHLDPVDPADLEVIGIRAATTAMAAGKTTDEIARDAIEAMLESVEGRNELIPELEAAESDAGQEGGVGLLELWDGNAWIVALVHPHGALANGPVRPGWQLIKIDGVDRRVDVSGHASKLLQGAIGSPVQLTLLDPTERSVSVTAERVSRRKMKTVVGVCGETSHVRLLSFRSETHDQLLEFLESCKRQDMQSLVIDLRGNTGGTLDALLDTAALFVGDAVLFHIRIRNELIEWNRNSGGVRFELPVMLLVDRYTAAGGEIFASALRRLLRVLVVGETTYGDARIHTVFYAGRFGHMKLLTGLFENPNGQSPVPVVPDINLLDDPLTEIDEVHQAASAALEARAD